MVTRGIDRIQEDNEKKIFNDNFGGLNLTASDVNIPYSDSPLLYNCDVDTSGNITKRRGTEVLFDEAVAVDRGFGYFNFITGLQYSFIIEKAGISIRVYEPLNNDITLIMTKSSVWTTEAEEIIPSICRTSERYPRVIFCTGVNQPVQLQFAESQEVASGSGANYVFSNAEVYSTATTSNLLVYKNRTRVTPSGVSYLSGNLTLTGVSYVDGDVIDIILITWQHIVEALYLEGDDFTGRATRNDSVLTDQSVEIPAQIRFQDLPSDYPVNTYSYGFGLYNSDRWDWTAGLGWQYPYNVSQNPVGSTQWASSNGTAWVAGTGALAPSPLFATFGALLGTGVSELFIAKRFDLWPWFNGGTGFPTDLLWVTIDDVFAARSTNPAAGAATFGNYYELNSTGGVALFGDNDGRFVTFEASLQMGVASNSTIKITLANDNFIGAFATTSIGRFADGLCYPVYGMGQWFDYLRGVFPRYCAVFENRLVFAGQSNNPLQIIISEFGDETDFGEPYKKFQIRREDTDATDPIEVNLAATTDDFITGLAVWQNSLIVFTLKAAYRIYGNDQQGLTPTSALTSIISNHGLINDRSWAKTDDSILYLSESGVQRLAFGVDSQDYQSNEVSIKIRPVFSSVSEPAYISQSFMTYDSKRRKVYLGLPNEGESTSYSKRLFVYDVFRSSWTEYKTDGDFRLWAMLDYQDNLLGETLIGVYSGWETGSRKIFLKFEDDYYLDFRTTATGTGSALTIDLPTQHHQVEFTVLDKVYTYYTEEFADDMNWFEMIPNDDVNDLYVTLDGVPLTLHVDYEKHALENAVELLSIPIAGQTLVVTKRTPITDYEATKAAWELDDPIDNHKPYHLVSDNKYLRYNTDYTVNDTLTDNVEITTVNHPVTDAVVYAGQFYEARYTSPLLVLSDFSLAKRGKHVYVYFDNSLGLDQWRASDVNSTSGQDPEDLIGYYKVRLNANVDLFFNSSNYSDVGADIYSFYSLLYDLGVFDIDASPEQSKQYSLFKESLLGIGYSYKLGLWSYDDSTFTMSAWQITNRINKGRYIGFTG